MRLQHNFRSASKKISQKATNSVSDQISQAFSQKARKASDVKRLSIASLAKEDYQNVVCYIKNDNKEVPVIFVYRIIICHIHAIIKMVHRLKMMK